MSDTSQSPASATNDSLEDSASLTPTLQGEHTLKLVDVPVQCNFEQPYSNDTVLIVDWDGPNDSQNPKNWSANRKWAATLIVASFSFMSPVSSSMIAPATGQVASTFGIDNDAINALTTSIFVLAYAFGPLFVGPMSEIYGRSRVLQLSNLWYLAWNLACGFAQTESQLLAFRFLAGLGGSAPLSIGGGVLGDCWRPEERGRALALYSLAPMLGAGIGPLTGAWIAERSTWRWVFWSTSIIDAAVQILGVFLLQETYAPLLLERKAERIRRSMDAEKAPYREIRTVFDGQDRSWQTIMGKALVRPFALFFREPIVQILGVYMAYLYGTHYRKSFLFSSTSVFLTTIPSIFQGVYQQPVGIAGLHYIALGAGLMVAAQVNARTLDKVYVYFKNKNGGVGKPEFRLLAMFPGTLLLPIGCLIAGWTAQARTHWIFPDIGILLVGAGSFISFQCIQAYVVDCFTLHAASALAAVCCLRSLAGFGFPLFAPAMYGALGFGKGDTILAAVAIVIGCPAPWIFWYYGERIRNGSRYAQS
ncbi:MFS polyamine transporter [Suillus paluster]|uniref:MFS polyamine transporter n=1 Tax=Suillus paluster TaxID=48578 RepID=UPI001B873857|nr:MFS polyamine transporter [Suillus paluster]XP_041173491.1 MFS polyamine transporter [Suillus paluster]KAG1727551.1 MFS polyamine transporter [Suillus paluster]KAG1731363.1 MFS polyamine transporter [Suillus paluster]